MFRSDFSHGVMRMSLSLVVEYRITVKRQPKIRVPVAIHLQSAVRTELIRNGTLAHHDESSPGTLNAAGTIDISIPKQAWTPETEQGSRDSDRAASPAAV